LISNSPAFPEKESPDSGQKSPDSGQRITRQWPLVEKTFS
jgi:hypothetical protein